jgi:membrane protease YdiL (CAAX protease family)
VEKPSISNPLPLSPRSWPADAFSWQRSLLILAALAVAFYIGLVLDGETARLLGTTANDIRGANLTWGITIGQYFSYLPLLCVLLIGLPWAARQPLSALGLRGFDRKTVVAGLIGFAAMYAVTIGIADLQFSFTHQKPEETAITLFNSTRDGALIGAFTFLATIAAPFMEEFVYRGFLFNALLRYAPVWFAALLSGILFGLSHGSSSAFFPLAGSGIVLAYVYWRSGSLTAAMISHALFNLANVALISLAKAS